jgi:hypothetical protein
MTDDTMERELHSLDMDGALREGIDELSRAAGFDDDPFADPFAEEEPGEARMDRRGLVGKGALGVGALAGGAALFGFAAPAAAQRSKRLDRAILNYALTLEYLEAAFYTDAIAGGALRGETLRFAQVAGAHEDNHVTLLRAALGSAAVRRPRFDFGTSTATPAAFRETALVLEDTGVRAYNGQITRLLQPAIITVAAQIHAVEARHAAWIADILGRNPAPAALNGFASRGAVLAAVRGTGFIVG